MTSLHTQRGCEAPLHHILLETVAHVLLRCAYEISCRAGSEEVFCKSFCLAPALQTAARLWFSRAIINNDFSDFLYSVPYNKESNRVNIFPLFSYFYSDKNKFLKRKNIHLVLVN
jgi:hypothetical protein